MFLNILAVIMKNKPHSHQSSNTFRFKGFHERIKSIKVNKRNFLLKKLNSENEDETLLWQTIQNLREENITGLFQVSKTSTDLHRLMGEGGGETT